MVNIRTKGQVGEREVADALNLVLYTLFMSRGMRVPAVPPIQRNQNQSAVGGSDLTNKLGLSIEVKRQETLSINTWWKQCVASANQAGYIPVLIYRQSRQAWKVVMPVKVEVHPGVFLDVRGEISWEDFQAWFKQRAEMLLNYGVNLYAD